MIDCRVCGNKTDSLMSFGDMPVANGFVSGTDKDDYVFELSLEYCANCFMVQLGDAVKPEVMFNSNYHFISSTSRAMSAHFEGNAREILEIIKDIEDPFVIELGCNDGIMLKNLAQKNIRHLGIEPSGNVAELARQNHVNVSEKFFNEETALRILADNGPADVICGSNVFCHIENINSVFKGLEILLQEDGIVYFEDPYLLDIVKLSSFDQIYDEHIYYFSGLSVSELAKKHDMGIVKMVHQNVHGGSMRYYLKKLSSNNMPIGDHDFIDEEKAMNLHKHEGLMSFKINVDKICIDLKDVLKKIKSEGGRIVGYGATSKSTTLLNYAGIDSNDIEYICDTTPGKIGKYTPGTHIPIKSYEDFIDDNPPYTLLLAWNHKTEIFEKEKKYRNNGGKFITYFPQVIVE